MATKPLDLPPTCAKLYSLLDGKGDVDILDIYSHLFNDTAGLRYAQQRLGSPITRLNRRIREHRKVVKPGRLKGTYVLTTL